MKLHEIINDKRTFRLLDSIYRLEEGVLTESSHDYRDKAVRHLILNGIFTDVKDAKKFIESRVFDHIPSLRHGKPWTERFILGIAMQITRYMEKNHLVKDPDKRVDFLNEVCMQLFLYDFYFKHLLFPEIEGGKIDRKTAFENFKADTFEHVLEVAAEETEKYIKDSAAVLETRKYAEPSQYKLIPITSYKQMNSLFGGLRTGNGVNLKDAWCHTNGHDTYDNWTGGEEHLAMFFVLAKRGWETIKFNPETNRKTPYDEYGTSLIAINVSTTDGSLQAATLRSNHVGEWGNADQAYETWLELSDQVGFNVKKTVKAYLDKHVDERPTNWKSFDGSANWLERHVRDYSKLETINIPNGVSYIGPEAFRGFTNLQKVRFSRDVKKIDFAAFYGLDKLKSVDFTLCDTIEYIGESAFEKTGLISVAFDNVEKLGDMAFADCKDLKQIIVYGDIKELGYDVFYGVNKDFCVVAKEGTNIQKYCMDNNIPFKSLKNAFSSLD